jgi:hypothetical protein
MFDRDISDFAPVEIQLRDDFSRLCSSLQDSWVQIEKLSVELSHNAEYQRRTAATVSSRTDVRYRKIDQNFSSVATTAVQTSASGSFNVSDTPPSASDSLPS